MAADLDLSEHAQGGTSGPPMNATLALVVAAALFVVGMFAYAKWEEHQKKLAPMVWYWIPWVGHHYEMRSRPEEFFRECQQKYGNTFRIMRLGEVTTFALGDMELVQTMYRGVDRYFDFLGTMKSSGFHITFDSPEFDSHLMKGPLLENLKMRHGVLRRKFTPSFPKYAKYFQPEVNYTCNELLPGQQGTFSSTPTFRKFTGRMSTRVLCGQEFARNDGLLADIYDWLALADTMTMMWTFYGMRPKMRECHKRMYSHLRPALKERRAMQAANPDGWMEENNLDDFMSLIIDSYTYSASKKLEMKTNEEADENILKHMRGMFLAALGNTTQAIELNFIRLVADPKAYKEACDEVGRVCGELAGGGFDETTLRKLEFLDAAWYEGCRFMTPLRSRRMIRERAVPLEGGKYMAPVDSILATSPRLITSDPKIWPKPDEYIPWRMMTDGNKELRAVGSYSYLTFGAARHACLGRPMAAMEFKLTVAELLRKYHVEVLPGPDGKLIPDLNYKTFSVTPPIRTTMIRYKLRQTPLGG